MGFSDPGINPIKNHQWRITRVRAVTTRNEGWEVILSAVLEVGLAYIGLKRLGIPRVKILKDVGHKTVYKGVLKKMNYDLSKQYLSGIQIYDKSSVYMRLQIHNHTISSITKNPNRYPHLNVEFQSQYLREPLSNQHIIFHKDYFLKNILHRK